MVAASALRSCGIPGLDFWLSDDPTIKQSPKPMGGASKLRKTLHVSSLSMRSMLLAVIVVQALVVVMMSASKH